MARFAYLPASVGGVAIIAAAAAFVLTGCSGSSDQPGYTPHPDVFALPRRIAVSVAPFESLEQALSAEPTVDWLHDSQSSNAVTLSFAAREICDHLALVNLTTTIDTSSSDGGPAILLSLRDYGTAASASATGGRVDYEALGDQGYAIVPVDGSIVITANTRQGLLYGAYSFLEQLGFAWYDPYETRVPSRSTLEGLLRWRSIQAVPRLRLRGFWIYGDQPVPDEFALWAARNKLNLGGRARLALQKKLGLKGWGGHHDLLQQEFSRDGLFEEHPDWFALIGGVRRPVEADPPDVYYNPAFWNPAVADYFADRIVERLESGDLRDIDVLNVWPADDRFNRFDQSEEALAVGNETDNMLLFYGNVASRLELAVAAGRLSRPVTLAGISYFNQSCRLECARNQKLSARVLAVGARLVRASRGRSCEPGDESGISVGHRVMGILGQSGIWGRGLPQSERVRSSWAQRFSELRPELRDADPWPRCTLCLHASYSAQPGPTSDNESSSRATVLEGTFRQHCHSRRAGRGADR
jgi:hypothetical protein